MKKERYQTVEAKVAFTIDRDIAEQAAASDHGTEILLQYIQKRIEQGENEYET